MKVIKLAVIGAGWIGTMHARAMNNVRMCYGSDAVPELELIVDAFEDAAKKACDTYSFNRYSTNTDDAINDPAIDAVMITTPNQFHVELVQKAAAAGKAIFCEKPLGMDGKDAKKALDAVKKYDTTSMVGFVYTHNPAVIEARKIIESGQIGDIVAFQGRYDMEYSADADIPHRWRDYDAISGALGDIGAHIIALQDYVTGSRITEVIGRGKTVYDKRPDPKNSGGFLPVTNDDIFNMMYNTDTGVMGMITTSRVAKGEKVGIRFEVQGTKGYIRFDQERMNELQVYIDGDPETTGCRRILMGPQHGQFGDVCTTQGLCASWVDLMTIQDYKFLKAIADGTKVKPDIESGYDINILIDALLLSDKEHRWVKVSECELD
ncbi:MAG TPA: Gfo/Idh/MocA family oxidoreductase [Candidatus Alectryocaccobium stercorigallinarum]|nr:Gfo/Idh/MocA family oxidoreductase [Candidatus Alectryocaccobium stercorigallinarum]